MIHSSQEVVLPSFVYVSFVSLDFPLVILLEPFPGRFKLGLVQEALLNPRFVVHRMTQSLVSIALLNQNTYRDLRSPPTFS